MDRKVYDVILQIWKYLKKYIPLATSNDDSVWDGISDESSAIYNSTEGMPEYLREMTLKMILAAIELLDGIHKEGKTS